MLLKLNQPGRRSTAVGLKHVDKFLATASYLQLFLICGLNLGSIYLRLVGTGDQVTTQGCITRLMKHTANLMWTFSLAI